MISKVFFISALVAASYCQDHSHSYTLKTVVKHEEPKKVEYHHSAPLHTSISYQPVQHHQAEVHQSHGHAVSSQSIVRHDSHGQSQGHHEAQHFLVPAHHQIAPVHEISLETPGHHVQQVPVQHHYVQQAHHEESHHGESHHEDYYAHPKYEFEYKVQDPHTKDEKYQHESRDGDVVKGVYSLHEADGSIRTVEYSADKKSGFHANVKHTGATKHVEPHHH